LSMQTPGAALAHQQQRGNTPLLAYYVTSRRINQPTLVSADTLPIFLRAFVQADSTGSIPTLSRQLSNFARARTYAVRRKFAYGKPGPVVDVRDIPSVRTQARRTFNQSTSVAKKIRIEKMSDADTLPVIEPYESGTLDVGDGHRVYWECCGNPNGKPAVFLHGGPGAGCSPRQRRLFDPSAVRAVFFDQRGCGRSRPLASDPDADLSANTTTQLIADMELLRKHLGVDTWTVVGISWGTTLGLAYAQVHPGRVNAMVLAMVTTTSRREVEWLTHDVGRIFPQQWQRFASAIPESMRHMRLVDAYATLLFDPDVAIREQAARAWCTWEDAHVSLAPGHKPDPKFANPEFRLRFARLVTHYWRHAAFLSEDQLLRDASKLDGIPGVLVHGRHDVSSPLDTAWRLSQEWSSSRLDIIDDAGHGGAHLIAATVSALKQFATRPLTAARPVP